MTCADDTSSSCKVTLISISGEGESHEQGFHTLIMNFDKKTNKPNLASTEAVDAMFEFSTSIGTEYSGEWISSRQLKISIGNPTGHGMEAIEGKVRGRFRETKSDVSP